MNKIDEDIEYRDFELEELMKELDISEARQLLRPKSKEIDPRSPIWENMNDFQRDTI